MRRIDLITHCWRYSRVLNYQLQSLWAHDIDSGDIDDIWMWVVTAEEDEATKQVVAYWRERLKSRYIPVHRLVLPLDLVLRREIGRNVLALKTRADLVWFLDCDYVFGPGCLGALVRAPLANDKLFFPRHTWINKTHALGDEYALRAAAGPDLYPLDKRDFMERRESKAIGGLQIVPGDVAREYGYCKDDQRLQSPVTDGKWKDTKGDFRYRKILGTRGTPIDLPNLFRIRQTTEGVVDTLL